jgi:hypothetical protein
LSQTRHSAGISSHGRVRDFAIHSGGTVAGSSNLMTTRKYWVSVQTSDSKVVRKVQPKLATKLTDYGKIQSLAYKKTDRMCRKLLCCKDLRIEVSVVQLDRATDL